MQLRWVGLHLARSLCDRFYQLSISIRVVLLSPTPEPHAKKNLCPMRNPVHFPSDGRAESFLSFALARQSRREIDREIEVGTVKIGLVRDTSQVLDTAVAWGC